MRYSEHIHAALGPMRRTSRHGKLYQGPCPFCADGGDDRFHVWMEASGGRPAERYWCRVCNRSGLLKNLDNDHEWDELRREAAAPTQRRRPDEPRPEHISFYRELYTATALWGHAWLSDPAHPDPRAYLHQRGLCDEAIGRYVLGVTLSDPDSLVEHLRSTCPEAFPYAEEAGLVITDDDGRQRTHWNLRGRIIFPYIAGSEVVDLRTRRYDGGKGYKSLAGGYDERGAVYPFGWDSVEPGTRTVIVTEAEFKALASLQLYHEGQLNAPTLGQPGLSVFRATWAQELVARGVEELVLCYDSQPRRPNKQGVITLSPEEMACVRHGVAAAAAGLHVRVARLPLAPGQEKAEIDEFIPSYGVNAFQYLIDNAPSLNSYYRSLERSLLKAHDLPEPSPYPSRRGKPRALAVGEAPACYQTEDAAAPITLEQARREIAEHVFEHASQGKGVLVLAQPPGTGKGFNTTLGLRRWMEHTPTGEDGSGYLVWTALRKDQVNDQTGLDLIPLHGRNPGNCRKLPEAAALAGKGYSVKDALCMRRCPFVGHCAYLRQFGQEGDFFAPTPLLKATSWWQKAGVVVLDEFDPATLIRDVMLSIGELAAMGRAHQDSLAIQSVLRWVAQATATTTERAISGTLFYDELRRQADDEGLDMVSTLALALDELPSDEELNALQGLANGATLAEYQALPPGYLSVLLHQIERELRKQLAGRPYTSRVEARDGRLHLYLRVEHLVTQLAQPDQPKIVLDATANEPLLRALFPNTPVRVERPTLRGAFRVIQVIGRDWAKATLGGARSNRRQHAHRERWFDDVASYIRLGRPTLVVCTKEWEERLGQALAGRGHTNVVVAHYGALRGSNAYKGYDVILAQIYNPNLDAIVREGRALFADDATPLDERVVATERTLRDATGASWAVPIVSFADERLAALLEQRRESELLQCALRGRPFDHPDVQITMMFSLPLPGLAPTVIAQATQRAASNAGRSEAARARLCAAAQQLLDRGDRVLRATTLTQLAGVSVNTTRKHWEEVGRKLGLQCVRRRHVVEMPRGGTRAYEHFALVRRGRAVPPRQLLRPALDSAVGDGAIPKNHAGSDGGDRGGEAMIDQARNKQSIARVIHHQSALRARRPRPRPRLGTSDKAQSRESG
jgi:hypothetical protein